MKMLLKTTYLTPRYAQIPVHMHKDCIFDIMLILADEGRS